MMKCINCNKEIGESKFCPYCGTKQVKRKVYCSNCGAVMDAEDPFCSVCGQKSYLLIQKEEEEARRKAEQEAARKKAEEEKERIKAEREAALKWEEEQKMKRMCGSSCGHDYVDLGLSVKWATCNIDAAKVEDAGGYYAWGETQIKKQYSVQTYKFYRRDGNGYELTKYNSRDLYGLVDHKHILEMTDDVANVRWGGSWRIPKVKEWVELRENCRWEWTTFNGVNGFKVYGNKAYSDRWIFLPAAGIKCGEEFWSLNECGSYWSSEKCMWGDQDAYYLYFDDEGMEDIGNDTPDDSDDDVENLRRREEGLSIRPVVE